MKGRLSLHFSDFPPGQWDKVIESITEYPRHNHFVDIAPGLTVAILLW